MAVPVLQIPGYQAPQPIDWSPLSKMADAIREGRLDEQRRAAVQAYAKGDQSALLTGDLKLANLYMLDQQRKQAQSNADRTFNAGREDAARSQANADRSYGLQVAAARRAADRTPTDFEINPDAATDPSQPKYRPLSGGPKDPTYIAQANAAKPRPMSVTDITKLSEEGGKYADLTRFVDTFKDEFSGKPVIGEVRNWVGRNLPTNMVEPIVAEGSAWWQGYDRYKNVVRNDLFGSALTAHEQQAFDKADITPGMNPQIVRKNLAIQKQIVENAMRRKAGALTSAGYSADVVNKAYGTAPAKTDSGVVDWQTYFGGTQ